MAKRRSTKSRIIEEMLNSGLDLFSTTHIYNLSSIRILAKDVVTYQIECGVGEMDYIIKQTGEGM